VPAESAQTERGNNKLQLKSSGHWGIHPEEMRTWHQLKSSRPLGYPPRRNVHWASTKKQQATGASTQKKCALGINKKAASHWGIHPEEMRTWHQQVCLLSTNCDDHADIVVCELHELVQGVPPKRFDASASVPSFSEVVDKDLDCGVRAVEEYLCNAIL
jgi:hypothetical protein